jgi:hypothetical protein
MRRHDLQSTQLEAQILDSDWAEYEALRRKRLFKLSTQLSDRELQLLDRGIIMDNWEWIWLNYRDVRLYMS